jgi:hypothetical protein
VERGGFLALTLRGRNLPGAAVALARAYPVRPVDVAALFLTEFRALVADRGQEWGKVLTTDARFGETGRIPPGLASYVRTCWSRVGEHLTEQGADGAVLFLHDAGLLARYAEAGGHDLLVALQAAARQPATAPHGMWLLCPAMSATGTPHSTTTSSKWSTGPSAWCWTGISSTGCGTRRSTRRELRTRRRSPRRDMARSGAGAATVSERADPAGVGAKNTRNGCSWQWWTRAFGSSWSRTCGRR